MNLDILGFAMLASILTVLPGQDTILVLRNTAQGGLAAGVTTTFGICSGLFLHASLSALGLSAILATSTEAYSALKLIGAGYLVWLGLQSLREARRPAHDDSGDATLVSPRRRFSSATALRQGFLSNALNPKTAAFYMALLPQFTPSHDTVLRDSLILGGVHFVIAVLWLVLVATAFERSRSFFARPLAARAVHTLAGVSLIGFGIRLIGARD